MSAVTDRTNEYETPRWAAMARRVWPAVARVRILRTSVRRARSRCSRRSSSTTRRARGPRVLPCTRSRFQRATAIESHTSGKRPCIPRGFGLQPSDGGKSGLRVHFRTVGSATPKWSASSCVDIAAMHTEPYAESPPGDGPLISSAGARDPGSRGHCASRTVAAPGDADQRGPDRHRRRRPRDLMPATLRRGSWSKLKFIRLQPDPAGCC